MSDPLVLVPAMMTDARLFAGLISPLSRDRGVSLACLTGGARMEDLAGDVLAAAPPRFALAGVELGGMVAMEMMRRAPERITRVALISTTPLAESPQHAAAREPQVIAARAGRLGEVMDLLRPADAFAPGPARLEVQRLLRHMAQDLGGDVFARQTRALQRRRDQQPSLRKWRGPALVLCGDHDTVYPPRRHKFMAELMGDARFAAIPGAGHMPMLEQPDLVLEALNDWLRLPVPNGAGGQSQSTAS